MTWSDFPASIAPASASYDQDRRSPSTALSQETCQRLRYPLTSWSTANDPPRHRPRQRRRHPHPVRGVYRAARTEARAGSICRRAASWRWLRPLRQTDYVEAPRAAAARTSDQASPVRMYSDPVLRDDAARRDHRVCNREIQEDGVEEGGQWQPSTASSRPCRICSSKAVEWRWLDRVPARPRSSPKAPGRIIALTDDAMRRADDGGGRQRRSRSVAVRRLRAEHGDAARRDHGCALGTPRPRKSAAVHPDAKAGEREQPITSELAEILAREREMRDDREGWIFPSPHSDSAAGHRARMDRPFREAVKARRARSRAVTPHVMRHTAITKLVQAGVDLPTIQRISGHKTLAMVLRYTHVHGRHIDEAIRAIGRTLPKQAANGTENPITPKLHQGAGSGAAEKPVNKPKLKAV